MLLSKWNKSEINAMQKADKPRVIIDTNLFISAIIIADRLPNRLLQAWKKDLYTLVISNDILEEIKDVLERDYLKKKYNLSSKKIVQLITTFELNAELANPLSNHDLPVHCRDAKDDKLLALALGGEVDYLITGDKDLLVLNGNPALKKLKILNVKEFIILFEPANT